MAPDEERGGPKLSRLSSWETAEIGAMGRGVPRRGRPSLPGLLGQPGCPLPRPAQTEDSRGHGVSSGSSFPTESSPSLGPSIGKGTLKLTSGFCPELWTGGVFPFTVSQVRHGSRRRNEVKSDEIR